MRSQTSNLIIFLPLIYFLLVFPLASHARQFIEKDHIVIDLLSGVEWLRCSTGQTWDGTNCSGKIARLNYEEIKEAIKLANEQLGGNWRLPTRKELEGIVCKECEKGHKINQEIFPSTPAEPYWTSNKNYWSKERYWTVNFFTGFSFSRFTGTKPLASRFVKDR